MVRRSFEVKRHYGLHARPAAAFVQLAKKFQADVIIEKNGERVNAKSIMGVLMLAIARGDKVYLEAVGTDENEAVNELAAFLESSGEDIK